MTRSAVLVEVPEVEPVIGGWRRAHARDAQLGLPPHVTLLFPFVPPQTLTAAVEERLGGVLRAEAAFGVEFTHTARFPAVLYLAPEPAAPFVRLTEAIASEWPEHLPYEGIHDTIVPHLTIAESDDATVLDRIAGEVEAKLPLESRVDTACLYVEAEDGRWRERRRLRLGERA